MDGNERDDVKKYRVEVFLPFMERLKPRMAKWTPQPEGPGLMHNDPVLNPGVKRVITVFQDESLFHMNEYKQNIWYAPWS